MSTAGFDSALFLSEDLFNETIQSLYDADYFPHYFTGTFESGGSIPGVVFFAKYEITINSPSVELINTRNPALRVSISSSAKLELYYVLANGDKHKIVDTDVSASASGDISLGSENQDGKTFFVADFSGLSALSIVLDGSPIPEKYREIIRRLLERLLVVGCRDKIGKLPISTAIRRGGLGMWPVTETAIRVVSDTKGKALALAFTTEPNTGNGDASRLEYMLEGRDFGVSVNTSFLVQTLDLQWRRGQIPTRFGTNGKPDTTGAVRLKAFSVNINSGAINVSANALLETDLGNQEVWMHGAIEVSYKEGAFEVKIRDVSIELPWAVHLLGFILFRLYYVLIAGVLAGFAGKLVEDVSEPLLERILNGGELELFYRGEIPGTGLTVQVVLAEMAITEDGILIVGDVEIQ